MPVAREFGSSKAPTEASESEKHFPPSEGEKVLSPNVMAKIVRLVAFRDLNPLCFALAWSSVSLQAFTAALGFLPIAAKSQGLRMNVADEFSPEDHCRRSEKLTLFFVINSRGTTHLVNLAHQMPQPRQLSGSTFLRTNSIPGDL